MIPATVITGFLGSGKTTLLKRILTESHGMKIAVIENEFGEENIDHEILLQDQNEQIMQMSNGCICCTIREDLRAGLTSLAERRRKGELQFDRLVIETTGLADPGPVTQTFFVDDEIAASYQLDAVLTMVDAKHANQQLDQHETAQRQIGFADQIFLSKTDLLDDEQVAALTRRLRQINARAHITKVPFGVVDLRQVFDLHGFNLNDKLEIAPDFLTQEEPHVHDEHCHHDHHGHGHHGHDHHGHDHHGGHSHQHDLDHVKSFVFRTPKEFDMKRLEEFLGAIVQVYGSKMLRYKGLLNLRGNPRQTIFQGVHMLMASDIGPPWPKNQARISKIVFIGVDLPEDIFVQGLQQCLLP